MARLLTKPRPDIRNRLISKKGELFWVHNKAPAGTLRDDGFMAVQLDGVIYMAHHLVVLLETGEWPVGCHVKHKNGLRYDNRLANLEICMPVEAA